MVKAGVPVSRRVPTATGVMTDACGREGVEGNGGLASSLTRLRNVGLSSGVVAGMEGTGAEAT